MRRHTRVSRLRLPVAPIKRDTVSNTKYFVPPPSAWPFALIVGMVLVIFGFGHWLESSSPIPVVYPLVIGAALTIYVIFGWIHRVTVESERGDYGIQGGLVDKSFRMGMTWFIFSEVMFFAGLFGALYYARMLSVPWLGGEGSNLFTNLVLWPDFTAAWPSNGPGNVGGVFEGMEAWGLAAINTVLLITSSFTLTIAHHKLKDDKRSECIMWMFLTVALGVVFLFCQGYEFYHAYTVQGMTMHSGAYGATFFMLTGFHGFHVTLGTIMLITITARLMASHFKPDHHFGFEAVAWYWHFVDVVWIGLFVFVYVLA